MKADELWEKYKYCLDNYDGDHIQVYRVDQSDFLAALHEYGALVRARDAEMIRAIGHDWEADDQRIKKYACDYLLLALTKEPLP